MRAGLPTCVAALAASLAFAAPAAAACPNDALRRESNPNPATGQPYSAALPDCRAYEVVSPPYKQEQDAEGISQASGSLAVSPGGDTAVWGSIGLFADPQNVEIFSNVYRSQSGASGWSTLSASVPIELVDKPLGGGTKSDSSPDLRSVQISCGESPVEQGQRGTGGALTLACARREGAGAWVSTPAYRYVDAASHLGYYVGGSADLTRVFLVPDHPLLSSDTSAAEQAGIYEIADCCTPSSRLRLVNVDANGNELVVLHAPPGEPPETEGPLFGDWRRGGTLGSAYHAVSESGGMAFFTATPNNATSAESEIRTVYARVNCGTSVLHSPAPLCQEDKEGREGEWFETVPVSNPSHEECNKCEEAAARRNATFQAASADGTKVFFTTTQGLLDHDSTYKLYEYDFNRPKGEKLVLLSPNPAGARVVGVVRTSPDGSHVYFVAEGVLTTEANGNHEKAENGQGNLYGFDTASGVTKFVARVSGELVAHIGSVVSRDAERHAQTTPDGRYLVFSTAGSLAGDLNSSAAQAVYRYDFETGELTWVSHGAPGFKVENEGAGRYEGEGRDALIPSLPGTIPGPPISADANIDDWSRAISEDGKYVIFATAEKLQANDANKAADVYEWHGGTVSMVSDGHDPEGIAGKTIALSSSGSDIFFTTRTALVGQDTDVLRDVYDAAVNRCVDGEGKPASSPETEAEASACKNAGGKLELAGFPRPQAAPSCSDDGCQGPSSPPEPFTPTASSLFTGGQNLTAPLISVASSTEAAPKRLTLAQQLAKALKACKRKPKRKRAACEAQARRSYGVRGTPKKTAKTKKRERRRR